MQVGIIGAGIVGLTTGLELQKEFPNARISLFADQFNEDTTSYVAAGIFRPGTSFSGPNLDITKKWITDAYHYWDEICKSAEGPLAGVCEMSGYIFSSISPHMTRNHYLEDLLPVYRRASEDELKLCHGDWKYGSFFTTLLTESKRFLPYAMRKFRSNGGLIHRKHMDSIADLPGDYDVILNCSGLGAKYLFNDHKVVPIRGQVLKVKAPWIKMAFYGDLDTYIIPGFETVTLGGCRQYESYSLQLSKYDSAAIRERCVDLLPSLKNASVVSEAVGLRPHRDTVRVEKELLQTTNGKQLRIVHNYGHGGYGVTTAPGTAIHAVKLVREIHSSNSKL